MKGIISFELRNIYCLLVILLGIRCLLGFKFLFNFLHFDNFFLLAMAKETNIVDQGVVNDLGSKGGRVEKPNNEEKFDSEIERKTRKKG